MDRRDPRVTVEPRFSSPAAEQMWHGYFVVAERLLDQAGLGQAGLAAELRQRLGDAFRAEPGEREVPRLLAAMRQTGTPAEALRRHLAVGLLDRGSRRMAPLTIARGLWHVVFTGARGVVLGAAFALGYAVVAGLIGLALLKPLAFRHVGLVRDADGRLRLGPVGDIPGSVELLGLWAVPLGLGLALGLFLALTLLLRRLRPR